ncbi:uncharacterized protein [Argopecten irradians]|uniref:uncharacterized protein n=1 Tax=Argopecten irradians TaxID=31199 RepID=UPI0037176F34
MSDINLTEEISELDDRLEALRENSIRFMSQSTPVSSKQRKGSSPQDSGFASTRYSVKGDGYQHVSEEISELDDRLEALRENSIRFMSQSTPVSSKQRKGSSPQDSGFASTRYSVKGDGYQHVSEEISELDDRLEALRENSIRFMSQSTPVSSKQRKGSSPQDSGFASTRYSVKGDGYQHVSEEISELDDRLEALRENSIRFMSQSTPVSSKQRKGSSPQDSGFASTRYSVKGDGYQHVSEEISELDDRLEALRENSIRFMSQSTPVSSKQRKGSSPQDSGFASTRYSVKGDGYQHVSEEISELDDRLEALRENSIRFMSQSTPVSSKQRKGSSPQDSGFASTRYSVKGDGYQHVSEEISELDDRLEALRENSIRFMSQSTPVSSKQRKGSSPQDSGFASTRYSVKGDGYQHVSEEISELDDRLEALRENSIRFMSQSTPVSSKQRKGSSPQDSGFASTRYSVKGDGYQHVSEEISELDDRLEALRENSIRFMSQSTPVSSKQRKGSSPQDSGFASTRYSVKGDGYQHVSEEISELDDRLEALRENSIRFMSQSTPVSSKQKKVAVLRILDSLVHGIL